jgi:hypothetical protein
MQQDLTPSTSPAAWTTVEESTRSLLGGKGDMNTLGRLVRGLSSLGVGSLVEPIVASITASGPAWEMQKSAILADARKLSGGRLPWAGRAEIFRANLAALVPSNPTLAGLEAFWREHQSGYDLLQANDGNFQVLNRQASSLLAGMMGGLRDQRALTRHWTYQCKRFQVIRPVAFDGPGYGWLLLRVLQTTHRTFLNYSCAVYGVEPDAASLCILLHLHDLRPWQSRLRLFTGPHAKQCFQQALADHDAWMLPAATINEPLAVRAPLNLPAAAAAVNEARQKRAQALMADISAYYDRITLTDWAARYQAALAGGRPLKVLGITSRFTTVLQYSMDELGAAVRAAGHEFILCKEADDHTAEDSSRRLIAEHKPDLLVLISRMRYENPVLPKNVPFLCWDQDNLPCMRGPEARKSLDALTYVAGGGAFEGYKHFNWPRRNCIIAFQAAAAHRYSNQPVSEALLRKHRCTFSYLSNASATPQTLIGELRARHAANPRRQAIFDQASAEIVRRSTTGFVWDALPLVKMFDEMARGAAVDAPVRQEMLLDLRRISDRAFRHVALGWVVDYCRQKNLTLRLYGSGWEANPLFGPYACGFLAPGEETRAVYQASDINLQLIEMGFQHSRSFDGLAAGGFFLYRAGAELREFDKTAESILTMTKRAQEIGCVTFGQLDASQDPLIAPGWACARTTIPVGKPHEVCEMLDRWNPAGIDEGLAHLDEIMFDGQEQFVATADRYLGDGDLRKAVAGKLRQAVVDRFSYDARWRQFLAGISAGLQSAAAESAAWASREAA